MKKYCNPVKENEYWQGKQGEDEDQVLPSAGKLGSQGQWGCGSVYCLAGLLAGGFGSYDLMNSIFSVK